MSFNATLADKTVIVTRPLAQAQLLMQTLESRLATTVHFPVISICEAENIDDAKQHFENLANFQFIIFISTNAVHYGISIIKELNVELESCKLAAVGPATKLALESYGHKVDIVPQSEFNSEALLAEPTFTNIVGQKILIVRGQGGREHLRQTLESRNAQVDYAEVYQRQLPKNRNPIDLSQLPIANCAVLLYSVESTQNLWSLCSQDEQQWLKKVTFIIASQRIAEAISRVGYANNSIIAENPSDQAILAALMNWSITQ